MLPRLRISDNKYLYRAKIEDTDFQIWEKNRTINIERKNEIIDMFKKEHYQWIPGYITVFEKSDYANKKQYFIIDGQHRYFAAKDYCENEYKNIGMDVCVINSSEPDVILTELQNVNKSVAVPDFLLQAEVNEDKRKLCEQVVEWMATSYKDFCVNSAKPRRPNFRKDDLLDTLYNNIPNNITFDRIKLELQEMNDDAKLKYENGAIKKCAKHNFYLFYEKQFDELLHLRLTERII